MFFFHIQAHVLISFLIIVGTLGEKYCHTIRNFLRISFPAEYVVTQLVHPDEHIQRTTNHKKIFLAQQHNERTDSHAWRCSYFSSLRKSSFFVCFFPLPPVVCCISSVDLCVASGKQAHALF